MNRWEFVQGMGVMVEVFFEGDLKMRAFLKEVISEGVNYFTIRDGTIERCFAGGENGAEEEGTIFLSV